ncbi:hypothetical protein [Vibrio alginolyticus]|uniref:hypothetical protein n=1 Tax=Vibrio alginolyticus TaxID=663 RepID=UPI001C930DF9|nr:hypothetical protein [Vibrio alginolyticus]MBY4646923.1 hypothetical protein [Vibrio alginolyticus]
MKNYFKSLSAEQPEERFFSLKLTKLVFWYFGFAFVITFTISLFDAVTLEFKPTSEGVNYLVFELFKAPVAVAGFALPILGLIGLNHRSEQTKRQLELASVQNNFANHYKYQEEFIKYCDLVCKISSREAATHAYNILFPESIKGKLTINNDLLGEIDELLIEYAQTIPTVLTPAFCDEAHSKMESIHKDLFNSEWVGWYYSINKPYEVYNDALEWDGTVTNYFRQFVISLNKLDKLLKFDPFYQPTSMMRRLLTLQIPELGYLNDISQENLPTIKQYSNDLLKD